MENLMQETRAKLMQDLRDPSTALIYMSAAREESTASFKSAVRDVAEAHGFIAVSHSDTERMAYHQDLVRALKLRAELENQK